MRSIILISPNKNEISCLYQQWKDRAENVFMDHEHLNMMLAGERIYILYLEEGASNYEEVELRHVDISEPSFYAISYSDREIMKEFIQQSVFSKGSYMDNDFGRIMLSDEIRGEAILEFIQ